MDDEYRARSYFLDKCGKLLWSFPNQRNSSWEVPLVGYNEELLVRGDEHASNGYIYSAQGDRLRGPMPMRGQAQSLGADGTIYNLEYINAGSNLGLNLVAYSWELQELWSLNLGPGYTNGGVVLSDEGVLYLARQQSDGIEVIGVQTQSPGLADTAMPTWLYNNRRTGWLE